MENKKAEKENMEKKQREEERAKEEEKRRRKSEAEQAFERWKKDAVKRPQPVPSPCGYLDSLKIYQVSPKKAERLIFVTLILKNI